MLTITMVMYLIMLPFGDLKNKYDCSAGSLQAKLVRVMGSTKFRHGSSLHSIEYSVDGRYLLSAGVDGVIRIWSTDNGCELASSKPQTSLRGPVFTPDSKSVVFYGPRSISIWNWRQGKSIRRISNILKYKSKSRSIPPSITDLVVHASGRQILWADSTGTVHCTDAKLNNNSILFKEQLTANDSMWNTKIGVSSNGKQIAFSYRDTIIKVFDLNTKTITQSFNNHAGEITHLEFDSSSEILISSSKDNSARIWSLPKKKQLRCVKGHKNGCVATLHPNRMTLFTADGEGIIRIWNSTDGRLIAKVQGNYGGVLSLAMSRTGKVLASCGEDEAIRFWDTKTGMEKYFGNGHRSAIQSLGFSSNGRRVLAGSRDGETALWDVRSSEIIRSIKYPDSHVRLMISQDGKKIVSISFDKKIRVWNTWEKDQTINAIMGSRSETVAFLGSNSLIYQDGRGNISRIQAKNGKRIWSMANKADVESIHCSQQNGAIALMGRHSITFLNSVTNKKISIFEPLVADFARGEFSQCGRVFAVLRLNSTAAPVYFLDVMTGRKLQTILTQKKTEARVGVFYGERKFIFGTENGELLLFDMTTKELRRIDTGNGAVTSICVTRNGNLLATGHKNTRIAIWHLKK